MIKKPLKPPPLFKAPAKKEPPKPVKPAIKEKPKMQEEKHEETPQHYQSEESKAFHPEPQPAPPAKKPDAKIVAGKRLWQGSAAQLDNGKYAYIYGGPDPKPGDDFFLDSTQNRYIGKNDYEEKPEAAEE